MKLIAVLLVISLASFLLTSSLIYVKPVFAASNAENTWESRASLPEAVPFGNGAVVDGKIYVIANLFNYQYDPATDTWTAKKPMPTPRRGFGIAVYQNKIFTFGGYNLVNGDPRYSYAVNEVYDPSTDTWQIKQPMPASRTQVSADVVGDEIYLIGGRTGDAHQIAVALNEVYNVANDSWTTKKPMPYPIPSHASAVAGGKIYIIGESETGLGKEMDDYFTLIYDPLNDSWTFGAPMPTPDTDAAAATTGAMALRRIYHIGGIGFNGSTAFLRNIVQVYDPGSNTWRYGAPMPTARAGLTIAVVNDKIYAIGGDVRRENEVYTPFGYGTPDPAYLLETVPPKISVLSPLNQTYNETSVPLNFTVDKAANWTGYSLDGQTNVTVTGNVTLTGLPSGSHNLTIYANDTYGNMGTSETLTFTIQEPFPIAPVAAVSGATATLVASAGIIVYRRKHRKNHPIS